jgi:hypothetical protein
LFSGKRSYPRTELRGGAGREQSGHDFGDNTFVIEELKQASRTVPIIFARVIVL